LDKKIKDNYPDEKSDLSMVMYKRTLTGFARENAYVAFITTSSWMFLSSFEKIRNYIQNTAAISTLVDYGTELFEGKVGHNPIVAWVTCKHKLNYKMTAIRLVDYCYSRRDEKEPEYFEAHNRHIAKQDNFSKIPGSPVAYWVGEAFFKAFETGRIIGDFSTVSEGIKTGDNARFLRLWQEIDATKFSFAKASKGFKWYPHHKGGDYRKWYGNLEYVINWENDGLEIRNSSNSGLQGKTMYFNEFAGWSKISSKGNPLRYYERNILFDSGAPALANKDIKSCLALFNTSVGHYYLQVISPTMNLQVGDVKALPLISNSQITSLVDECIRLSKKDWNSYETSWDFQRNPLIDVLQIGDATTNMPCTNIKHVYGQWKYLCNQRFARLKANEEELNCIFIDIYGLQDELTSEVADKDVTVHYVVDSKDEITESLKGSNYVRTKRDEIVSLISYAVGCMFGRYSLDEEGLAYAGGTWDESRYTTFAPDKDAIIPICDDEYFDDDIVGRFIEFMEIVFGEDMLEENLQFIADALDGKGTSREVIRNYFMNDFYADHLKTYQKRPIYWLFDSGKKNGFKCLIYMHRYQSDTIARIRTDYVHEQQSRYRTATEDLERRIATASTSERVKLTKQLRTLQDKQDELHTYEEKIHHLADQMISIDLDDGVKHNYAIFQDVLAKIK
jgi:hypothetical protein